MNIPTFAQNIDLFKKLNTNILKWDISSINHQILINPKKLDKSLKTSDIVLGNF
jgi:hypothetical protein